MRGSLIGLLALLGAATTLAACGGSERTAQPDAAREARGPERAFLSAMVPHHRGATEMAEAAGGKLRDPELQRMRGAIVRTQAAEIEQMERMHERLFGEPLRPDEGAHAQLGLSPQEAGMGHEMHGDALRTARPPVDAVFVDHMIPHHEGAIRMSEVVLDRTRDRELRRLAQDIIAAQREEIRTMESIRGELSESGSDAQDRGTAGGGGHAGH